jgi:hypothetical protein
MDSGGRPVDAVFKPENFLCSSSWRPRSPSARHSRSAGANGTLTPRLSTTPPAFSFCPPPARWTPRAPPHCLEMGSSGFMASHPIWSPTAVPLLRQNFPARCCRLTGRTHGFPSANGRPERARQFSSRAVSAGILQSSAGRPDGQLFVNGFLLLEFLDSEGTAALFWDGIFRLHGLPSNLVSDRGATFTSEFSRSLCCRLSGITHGFPSANGRPDRARQFSSRAVSAGILQSSACYRPRALTFDPRTVAQAVPTETRTRDDSIKRPRPSRCFQQVRCLRIGYP